MTTILTPVDSLRNGMEFMIGREYYYVVALNSCAQARNTALPTFDIDELRVLFPDGVPVIQPDKPKAVRCVVGRDINSAYLKDVKAAPLSWLRDNTEPGKTYDLVLTEREDSK